MLYFARPDHFARPFRSKHIKGRSREPFRKLVSLCTRDFLQKPIYNGEDKLILAIGPPPEYLVVFRVYRVLVNWTVLRCIMGYFLDRCLLILNLDNFCIVSVWLI